MTHLLATTALLLGAANPLPPMPKSDDWGTCWLYPSKDAFGEPTVQVCVWWNYLGFYWNGKGAWW